MIENVLATALAAYPALGGFAVWVFMQFRAGSQEMAMLRDEIGVVKTDIQSQLHNGINERLRRIEEDTAYMRGIHKAELDA